MRPRAPPPPAAPPGARALYALLRRSLKQARRAGVQVGRRIWDWSSASSFVEPIGDLHDLVAASDLVAAVKVEAAHGAGPGAGPGSEDLPVAVARWATAAPGSRRAHGRRVVGTKQKFDWRDALRELDNPADSAAAHGPRPPVLSELQHNKDLGAFVLFFETAVRSRWVRSSHNTVPIAFAPRIPRLPRRRKMAAVRQFMKLNPCRRFCRMVTTNGSWLGPRSSPANSRRSCAGEACHSDGTMGTFSDIADK